MQATRRPRPTLWAAFATPAIGWLAVFFMVPLYVVFAVAFGSVDPLYRSPVPEWNPLRWNTDQFSYVLTHVFGERGVFGPALLRTVVFVGVASLGCLLIAYPVAYYVARYGGRRRGLLLTLLVAPFWISSMMRLLAWVNLLQTDGLVNRVLAVGPLNADVDWLNGRATTVVLGLVYGYVPFMVLPLYAGLDRVDQSLLDAARDLGASRASAFRRVTLPASLPAVVAGLLLTTLPMTGDYFTSDLLSGSPNTAMAGNLINNSVTSPGLAGQAAAFVILIFGILLIPMLLYVRGIRAEGRSI